MVFNPVPLQIKPSHRFLKDLKRSARRGRNIDKLNLLVDQIQARQALAPRHHDHTLTGNWVGHRECHIEPDWLLIYRIEGEFLFLERTGTHTDLFD